MPQAQELLTQECREIGHQLAILGSELATQLGEKPRLGGERKTVGGS